MNNKISQIPLAHKNIQEYRDVVKKCKECGYEIHHGLDNIKDDERIVTIVVDTEDKTVFRSNITCMAFWSKGERRPIYAFELLENFEELVIKRNLKFYTDLLEKSKTIKLDQLALFSGFKMFEYLVKILILLLNYLKIKIYKTNIHKYLI